MGEDMVIKKRLDGVRKFDDHTKGETNQDILIVYLKSQI